MSSAKQEKKISLNNWECPCGKTILRKNVKLHEKTRKHRDFLQTQLINDSRNARILDEEVDKKQPLSDEEMLKDKDFVKELVYTLLKEKMELEQKVKELTEKLSGNKVPMEIDERITHTHNTPVLDSRAINI